MIIKSWAETQAIAVEYDRLRAHFSEKLSESISSWKSRETVISENYGAIEQKLETRVGQWKEIELLVASAAKMEKREIDLLW